MSDPSAAAASDASEQDPVPLRLVDGFGLAASRQWLGSPYSIRDVAPEDV